MGRQLRCGERDQPVESVLSRGDKEARKGLMGKEFRVCTAD